MDGKPKNQETLEVKSDELECLSRSEEAAKSLFSNKLTESKVEDFSSCLQKSFKLFAEKTRGAEVNEYSTEELYRFFSRYIIKSDSFHIELIESVLKLKSAFIGGSINSLTKDEIPKINHLIGALASELKVLVPVLPVLTFSATKADVNAAQIKKAVALLLNSLSSLSNQVEFGKTNYSFEDLSQLANSIGLLSKQKTYKVQLELVESALQIYFGSPMSLNKKSDWLEALKTSSEVLQATLNYHYLVTGQKINSAESLRSLSEVILEGLNSLRKSSSMKYQGMIRWSELDGFFDQIYSLYPKAFGLSLETLKNTYKEVLKRTTRPGLTNKSDEQVFYRESLEFLYREVNLWKVNQSQIDRLFSKTKPEITLNEFLSRAKISMSAESLNFYQHKLQNKSSILWTTEALPFIGYSKASFNVNWKGISLQNFVRTLNRLLLLGYGDQPEGNTRIFKEVSAQGLIDWYSSFESLGTELKFFDPRSPNSGARAFKEAKLFNYSSDGSGPANASETFDFLSLLVGSGFGNANKMKNFMYQAGCGVSQLDVFGFKKMSEACFKKNFIKYYSTLFSNLPDQAKYFQSLPEQLKSDYFSMALNVSRVSDPREGLIETADYRPLIMILVYNESLFVKFDSDRSNSLSLGELNVASSRFIELFKTFSPIQANWFVQEVFVYVVVHGRKPSASDLAAFKFNQLFGRNHQVERIDLLKVFATLKEALKN